MNKVIVSYLIIKLLFKKNEIVKKCGVTELQQKIKKNKKSFKKNMITIVDQIENYENNSRNSLSDYHIPRITHNTRTDFFSVLIDSSFNGYSYLFCCLQDLYCVQNRYALY